MLKRFTNYYKPHMPLFILDMAAAVIVAVCNLFYPKIAGDMIDDYVYRETPNLLIIWSAVLLGIYILKAICNYVMSYYGHVLGIKMQHDMRRDIFRKYERLPSSYYDEHKTGDLMSRLVNDLFDVAELAHHGPENLFLAILMLLGSFIILVQIDWLLTLITFAIIPFIVLFTILSRKKMTRAMSESRKQIAVVNISLENSIGGIRETKSYVAEHHEICKFDKANALFASSRKEAMKAMGSYHSIMQFLQDLLYLLIIFIGGLFLYNGTIETGEFAAFVLYVTMFLNPIQRFVTLFEQFQEGMTGFSRFSEIMNAEEECDEGKQTIDSVRGEIEFKNVSFSYQNDETKSDVRRVISNLDLHISAGKTLALVGPSGGGKTTLCNLIPRFYNIDDGEITIDGININDIKLESLRRNIGIVSQNIFLFDGTIKDNIAYGNLDATDDEIREAAKLANIHDFVTSLEYGYDTEVGERGVKLSGGQKQRIAIARVFLKDPSLLILDEATSALDNITEMQIQAALEKLSAGRTVIVVAHRLSTVKGADEIVVLDKNGIVEKGSHSELLSKDGEYKKLYSYQFKQIAD